MLALMAIHSGLLHGAAVTGLLLADVLIIVMGLYLGALITVEPKWLWFTISCGTSVAGCNTVHVLLVQNAGLNHQRCRKRFGRRWRCYSCCRWFIRC